MKRDQKPEYPQLKECVFTWLKLCRDKNVPLCGPIVLEKLENFTEKL